MGLTKERKRELLRDEKLPRLETTGFQRLFGDLTPKLSPSKRGRLRLIQALESRFGGNFRAYEAADEALKDFDDQVEHIRDYLKLKGVQSG